MELPIDRCFKDKSIDGILIDPLKSNVKLKGSIRGLDLNSLRKENLTERLVLCMN